MHVRGLNILSEKIIINIPLVHIFFLGGGGGVDGGGRLFEAGRLLTFPTFRVGAYSRWALIRGWALNRINTVIFLSEYKLSQSPV